MMSSGKICNADRRGVRDGHPSLKRALKDWKPSAFKAHILEMEAFIKIGLLATLGVFTLVVLPDRRRGAVIAVGTCVAMAVVLHFVAP